MPVLSVPSVQGGNWSRPSQGPFLILLFVALRFLPEDLPTNQVSQAGGQRCRSPPVDPVSVCPQLRSLCPFPFSWPQIFVRAAITCFRKSASLSTHTARLYRRPGHPGKLGADQLRLPACLTPSLPPHPQLPASSWLQSSTPTRVCGLIISDFQENVDGPGPPGLQKSPKLCLRPHRGFVVR